MESEYGRRFAEIYDLLYKDKPYDKEVDFVEKLFKKHKGKPARYPKKVLDVGCGTGGHSIVLANRGYEVTGVDKSDAMVELAKLKTAKVHFERVDITHAIEAKKLFVDYDAVVSMFGTLDYITENSDFLVALLNIRGALRRFGLFIFEVWNGLATISSPPKKSVKVIEDRESRIFRSSNPELHANAHICKVEYVVRIFNINYYYEFIDEFKEIHNIRFFFPMEIKHYLEEAGFKVLDVVPSMKPDHELSLDDWWMTVVAEAI